MSEFHRRELGLGFGRFPNLGDDEIAALAVHMEDEVLSDIDIARLEPVGRDEPSLIEDVGDEVDHLRARIRNRL